jgi:hypothetical protein
MAGDIEKKQQQKQEIQNDLKSAGVSRRGFIDRIKALGLGFGAAAALGVEGAEARTDPETSVNLTSTNPALNTIINEGRDEEKKARADDGKIRTAWFRRWYRRFFRRWYRRW